MKTQGRNKAAITVQVGKIRKQMNRTIQNIASISSHLEGFRREGRQPVELFRMNREPQ